MELAIIFGIILFILFIIFICCSTKQQKVIISFFKDYFSEEEIEKRKLFRKLIASLDDEEWKSRIDRNYDNAIIILSLVGNEKSVQSETDLSIMLNKRNKISGITIRIKITNPGKPVGYQITNLIETTHNMFITKKLSKFVKKQLFEESNKINILKVKNIKEINDGIDLTLKSIKRNKRDSKIKNILKNDSTRNEPSKN